MPMFLCDGGDTRQLILRIKDDAESFQQCIRGQHLAWRTESDDAARQEHDEIAERGFLDVVRSGNETRTARQLRAHRLRVKVFARRVQSRGRLVEDDEIRPVREHLGEVGALLLPARQGS